MRISTVWIIWSTLSLHCIEVRNRKETLHDLTKVIRTDDLMNYYDAMGVHTMQ